MLQGCNQSRLVLVVDGGGADARREGALAVCARERGYGVLACLEEFLGDVFAYGAADLVVVVVLLVRFSKEDGCRPTPTMATRSMRLVKPDGWSLAYFWAMLSRYCIGCDGSE